MNICYPNSLLSTQLLEKYGPEVRDRVMSHINSDQFKEKFGQFKAEASTFTYKGNTIETPFKLSIDQEQALNRLSEFINDPSSISMTLEGAAGTGKTTIIGLLKKLTNSKFVFSAPTHAATAELAKAVVRFGETRLPTTVRSGLAPKKDENGKQVYENGVPQYVFAKKVQDRFGYGSVKVLVVDEVSMIGDSDFANLHTAAKNSGVKIIFLGDRAQLPEPKSPTISKAFTEIPSTNLTTVHRQKDQQLAEFLTQVRSMNSFVPLKLENSATTTFTPDRLTFEQQFVEQVKKDPEGTVWIADTNKAVKEANTHIRDLFNREGAVQKGDVLVGYLGYESKQVEKGNLANAISYTVESATKDPNYPSRTLLRLSSKRLNDLEDSGIDIPTIVQSTYLQLSSSDSLQSVDITPELMTKNNEFVSNYFEAIVNAKDRKQWKMLDTAKTEVAMTFAKIDLGDNYIYNPKTKKMELYNPSSPEHSAIVKVYGRDVVIEKGVDFGHAITIYKAQGATIPHVFVDMGSFRSVADQEIKDTKGNPVTTVKQSLYYVALSRAQDSLTVYQGNFGFLPYTPKPAQPKANPNEPTLEWVEQNVLDLPEVQSDQIPEESTQIKPGVQEVFESNPELSAIGTQQLYSQYLDTIFPDSKVKETVYHNTTTDFEEFKVGKDGAIHFGDKEAARQRTKNVVGVKFTKESKINIENLTEGVDSLDFDPPTNATKEEKAIYFELLKKADNETKEHIIALYKSGKISLEQAHKLIDEGWSLEKIYKELFNADGYFYINQAENKGSISYVVFKPEQIHVLGSKQDIEGFKKFVGKEQLGITETKPTLKPETAESIQSKLQALETKVQELLNNKNQEILKALEPSLNLTLPTTQQVALKAENRIENLEKLQQLSEDLKVLEIVKNCIYG